MKHEWERERVVYGDYGAPIKVIDRTTTETLTPPPGRDWVLTSKFGVGRVKGAGGSPSRTS